MDGTIVAEMAALAQGAQVGKRGVGGVVIEMGGGGEDPALARGGELDEVGPGGAAAGIVAPAARLFVEPSSVRQLKDAAPVRAAAGLAASPRPLEAHEPAQERPVDRIEPAQIAADRHSRPRVIGFSCR